MSFIKLINIINLEKYILKLWYGKSFNNSLKIILLIISPLSIIYYFYISLRKYLYNKKILTIYRSDVPVIVVGNITVGGTGKTPVVIELTKYLLSNGYKPGIVSRGYNKNNKLINHQPVLINNNTDISISGDEAKLIFNNTNCPVVISKSRTDAVKFLLNNNLCDIIISDDGLQHYKLARDIEICVVDRNRLFGNGYLLPAGPLRETTNRLHNIDYLLFKNIHEQAALDELHSRVGKSQPNKFNFILNQAGLINLKTGENNPIEKIISLINLKSKKKYAIYAMSAIGNNNSFIDLLNNLNFYNLIVINYPDHYDYNHTDFDLLKNQNNIIITTEKDAVKIKELESDISNFDNIYYLKVAADLPKEFLDHFLLKLKKI